MEAFVVRVWVPADGVAPDDELRGVVTHTSTGREWTFGRGAALLDALRGAVGSVREPQ